MKYPIIFSDLDGTLLGTDMRVSKENLAGLRQYTEMGGIFVPTSGRCYYELPEDVRGIEGIRYFLCSNGADIYDRETGEHISLFLEGEQVRTLFSILRDYDFFPLLHHNGRAYYDGDRQSDAAFDHYHLSRYYRAMIRECVSAIPDLWDFCNGLDALEMTCVFFHSEAEMEECRLRLQEAGFMVAASEKHNIEVYSPEAGKGNALLRLAAQLGIPREHTVAVGDSANDVSMIRAAGLGLAVGNAWPVLLENADKVICRNDEHVMSYLLENIL